MSSCASSWVSACCTTASLTPSWPTCSVAVSCWPRARRCRRCLPVRLSHHRLAWTMTPALEQPLDLRLVDARLAQHLHRVLADLGRHRRRHLLLALDLQRAADRERGAGARVVERHQRAAGRICGVVRDVVDGADDAEGDAAGLQHAPPLRPVALGEDGVEDGDERADVGAAGRPAWRTVGRRRGRVRPMAVVKSCQRRPSGVSAMRNQRPSRHR